MIRNLRKGLKLSGDLPRNFVRDIAKYCPGEFVSMSSERIPLKNRKIYFKENPANKQYKRDVRQFKNSLFVP